MSGYENDIEIDKKNKMSPLSIKSKKNPFKDLNKKKGTSTMQLSRNEGNHLREALMLLRKQEESQEKPGDQEMEELSKIYADQ